MTTLRKVIDDDFGTNAMRLNWSAAHNIEQPSAKEIQDFVDKLLDNTAWAQERKAAFLVIKSFAVRSGPLAFVRLNRYRVALQLLHRVDDYLRINQRNTSLCGPVALLTDMARRNRLNYVRFIIDLAEWGIARFNELYVRAGKSVLAKGPLPGVIAEADYIGLAGLRSSEALFGYDKYFTFEALQGATTASNLEGWMRRAGYSNVRNKANTVFGRFHRGLTQAWRTEQGLERASEGGTLYEAIDLCRHGHTVMLVVSMKLANAVRFGNFDSRNGDWKAKFSGHFVLLNSATVTATGVKFQITSWGEVRGDCEGVFEIPFSKIASWYWGYVSGDPSGIRETLRKGVAVG